MRAAMQRSGVPAVSVGLARGGVPIYVQSYGLADVSHGAAASPDTVFELGSVTKQFTAALILQLQEAGQLHVDDPAVLYLPQYSLSAGITLRMLLNHTSGLPDFTNFPAFQDWYVNGVAEATVLEAIGAAPLDHPPGTAWEYSNSNYFVLGVIIEKVTGQSYALNVQQRILAPLGLASITYRLPQVPPGAVGYTDSGGSVVPIRMADRSALFAAGALSADVKDLLGWDHALYSGAVVSQASFGQMVTPAPIGMGGGSFYGFGLVLDNFAGRPRAWHNGFINGFLAYNEVFLDDGLSLALLTNGDFIDQQALGDAIYDAVCNSSAYAALC
ncbi:MAG: beta-lactamase family protein [Gammaproteobacteria bacterium]|nr:beta-lactamase family protein [Gammaproteobacteria bacterium]